ncbi:MAG TPA: hypothetical protein VFP05_17440 [Thermomicrobiales bacterium]|nr:hypothetical protein [Thermomicrobiales bacterium]
MISVINLLASISALLTAIRTDQFRLVGLTLGIVNALLFAYFAIHIASARRTDAASRQRGSRTGWERGSNRSELGRLPLVAAAFAVCTFGGVWLTSGETSKSPNLTAASSLVPRGDEIRLGGNDFPPRATIRLAMISIESSGALELPDPVTNSEGNFIAMISTGELDPGRYRITASVEGSTRTVIVEVTERATHSPTALPTRAPAWTVTPVEAIDTPPPADTPMPTQTSSATATATATVTASASATVAPSPTNTPCDVDGCPPDDPVFPGSQQEQTTDPNQEFALPGEGEATVQSVVE